MEQYYIIVEGQKLGPFDIIGVIKKVKGGMVTPDTQVATSLDGEYKPASSYEDIASILNEHGVTEAGTEGAPAAAAEGGATAAPASETTKLDLKKVLKDGIDLWSRNVVGFTIVSGLILSLAFALKAGFEGAIGENGPQFVGYYITSTIVSFLYILFFNYILYAKRSQAPDVKEFLESAKTRLGAILGMAALFSLYNLGYALGSFFGLIALVGMIIMVAVFAFAPFLVLDKSNGLAQAFKNSSARTFGSGSDNFGVIFALVALNLVAAIIPAFLAKELFVFLLFISIPITVSALAYIYDELFA